MKREITYLSLTGLLGYGYHPESLRRALERDLDFIGVDGGSSDPGPFYLGSGVPFVKHSQIKRDLGPALRAALERRIPLIVGSAGGCGARPHVQAVVDIVRRIAREDGLRLKAAVIPADLEPETIRQAAKRGLLRPCGNAAPFDANCIPGLLNPVAQFGTGPICEALDSGADLILAGRCCDTAVFAALPISRGIPAGLALHAAKIAECGALCARPVGANDGLIVTLGRDSFVVEPAHLSRACTPDSVTAHSLYEQPDPERFYEPEGMIDMSDSVFEQVSERVVRVSGTRLIEAQHDTLKLEGAELRGFRSITIAGLRDPAAIGALDEIESGVREAVAAHAPPELDPERYSLRFLRYGIDGVTGGNETMPEILPREVGLVIEAVAPTQEHADALVSLARVTALHQPFKGRKATAGNLAFPFSPSDYSGGPVFEFSLYHLMDLEGMKLQFPHRVLSIGGE